MNSQVSKYKVAAMAVVVLLMSVCFGCGNVAADRALSRHRAAKLAEEVWQKKRDDINLRYGQMWDKGVFVCNNAVMPIYYKVFGEKPADGRSLYISLHGGGNVPAAINDSQWENQKVLYTPSEGVYVAPRAAVNDWNMWLRPHIDTLFARIIQAAVVKMDVNPDKVYLLGYSAGGDGVYRMAPRLADHWAAASMMAGHSGESSPLNLRNIGYMTWMGQNDAAYDRNILAVKYGALMDSLQSADSGGYVHETHIMEGKGHWMDRADTVALSWMAQFRRNPYPERVVWRQESSNLRSEFYYLSIPREQAETAREVRVDREGNTFTILRNDYPTLYLNLNDRMVDLSAPIVVMRDGKEIYRGRVARRASHIVSSAERGDPDYIFSAQIEICGDKVRAL